MTWRNCTTFTMDCVAVLAGALIASPFVLILSWPLLIDF